MAEEKQKTGSKEPMRATRKGVLALIVLCAGFVIGGYGVLHFMGKLGPAPVQQQAPTVGGPFTMVNQNGKTVTDADFRGRYMLIFFGYTYCPDVCPTTLTDISEALDILGKQDAAKIAPIFVTVDPERDTAQYLKEYVSHFDPSIVGLTGTPEQVKQIAKEYKVYYKKVQQKGAEPDDYLMDHTALIYLMGPDGKYLAYISHGTPPKAMAEKIKKFM